MGKCRIDHSQFTTQKKFITTENLSTSIVHKKLPQCGVLYNYMSQACQERKDTDNLNNCHREESFLSEKLNI